MHMMCMDVGMQICITFCVQVLVCVSSYAYMHVEWGLKEHEQGDRVLESEQVRAKER